MEGIYRYAEDYVTTNDANRGGAPRRCLYPLLRLSFLPWVQGGTKQIHAGVRIAYGRMRGGCVVVALAVLVRRTCHIMTTESRRSRLVRYL
jgi:hypothetical protein